MSLIKILLPVSQIQDPGWLSEATPEELSEVVEANLIWPWGNHHDACLFASALDDPSLAPGVEAALRWVDAAGSTGLVSCTRSHCMDALADLSDPKNSE